MTFTDVLSALPHVQSGRLRMLGVTAAARSHVLPDVPTVAEQGIAGDEVSVFFALVAPRGLAAEPKKRLSAALQQVFAQAEFQALFKKMGLELPVRSTPEYLDEVMRREVPMWRKLIQDTGATPD